MIVEGLVFPIFHMGGAPQPAYTKFYIFIVGYFVKIQMAADWIFFAVIIYPLDSVEVGHNRAVHFEIIFRKIQLLRLKRVKLLDNLASYALAFPGVLAKKESNFVQGGTESNQAL